MTLENSLQKENEKPWNSSDFTGRTIAGHKIIRKLGEGGFGVVYLAEKDNRKFALKFLKENKTHLVNELKKEYRLVSGIRHPNVLRVHGFDAASSFYGRFEPSPFIIMDYVEGLKALDVTEITNDKLYQIMNQTIEGLQAAHDSGLIHKDLKPNNILITPDNQAKISDFGLGKIITEHPEFSMSLRQSLSRTKESAGLEGTLGYFPPDPEEHKNPDKRFDLYSLGVIFYLVLNNAKQLPRRQFLEGTWAKIAEFCALIPVAGLAVKSLISRKEYPVVKLSPVEKIKEYQQSINQLEGCFTSVKNDLDNLWSHYKKQYYKSRTETRTVPEVDMDGNVTLRIETETVYYWEVPKGLPDKDTVKKWRDNTEDITNKIASVSKQPFFDHSENNFEINKEKANLAGEIAILACAYGSIGAALMFYEEGLELFTDKQFSASKNTSRRNLLKLGTVAAASVPVYLIGQHYAELSDERTAEAGEKVKKILYDVRNLSDKEIISEVVGDTPANLINTMNDYATTAQNAIGYREGSAFASLFSNAKISQNNLQRILNPISEQISIPMRNAYGLKKVGEFNTKGSTGILLEHLLEAGVFGGILATVLGISEPILQTTK
ncbi:MAG: serine/threonine-protein kinase [Candidatus Woesearchaeota archaeon]|nr:serine/threonine-protein kinase [Candidatus Woesearchaeota archaeon]